MRRVSFSISGILAALLASSVPAVAQQTESAVFAGGCFWSVESNFEKVPGVIEATSGFSGGSIADPSYMQVVRGGTGHLEAVKVEYDPAKVSYEALLDAFWHSIDPTDPSGQFCDNGDSYRTAIFVADAAEQDAAEATKREVAAELGKPVVTEIRQVAPFYPAEAEHQDFAEKNPAHYERYRIGCGRDAALKRVWGDKTYSVSKDKLG